MGEETARHNGVEGTDSRSNSSDPTDARLRRIVRVFVRQFERENHAEYCTSVIRRGNLTLKDQEISTG